MCPSGLTFFGLITKEQTAQFRKNLFITIHNILFHGKGGYDFYTIYNMTIWLRRFTWSEMDSYYKDEAKAIEEAKKGKKGGNTKTLVDSSGKVNTPEFLKATKEFKGKTSYK